MLQPQGGPSLATKLHPRLDSDSTTPKARARCASGSPAGSAQRRAVLRPLAVNVHAIQDGRKALKPVGSKTIGKPDDELVRGCRPVAASQPQQRATPRRQPPWPPAARSQARLD